MDIEKSKFQILLKSQRNQDLELNIFQGTCYRKDYGAISKKEKLIAVHIIYDKLCNKNLVCLLKLKTSWPFATRASRPEGKFSNFLDQNEPSCFRDFVYFCLRVTLAITSTLQIFTITALAVFANIYYLPFQGIKLPVWYFLIY